MTRAPSQWNENPPTHAGPTHLAPYDPLHLLIRTNRCAGQVGVGVTDVLRARQQQAAGAARRSGQRGRQGDVQGLGACCSWRRRSLSFEEGHIERLHRWDVTCRRHSGFGGGQAEAVVDVGGQQVVAAVLVLIPLQILVDLVDQ